MKSYFGFIFVLLFIPTVLFAQNDSAIKYVVPDIKLYYIVNGRGVITDFDDPRNEFTLTRDTLYSNVPEYKFKTSIGNLNKIVFMRTKINPAFIIPAFLIGSALGYAISGFGDSKGSRIFSSIGTGVVFAAVTGLVSLMYTPLDAHDMTYLSPEEKWVKLKRLLKENRVR